MLIINLASGLKVQSTKTTDKMMLIVCEIFHVVMITSNITIPCNVIYRSKGLRGSRTQKGGVEGIYLRKLQTDKAQKPINLTYLKGKKHSERASSESPQL